MIVPAEPSVRFTVKLSCGMRVYGVTGLGAGADKQSMGEEVHTGDPRQKERPHRGCYKGLIIQKT